MTDDELIAKVKASVDPPKEADDPRFWQAFGADLDRAIVRPRRRWPALAAFGAVAAAAVLAITLRAKPPVRAVIMQDELALDADGNSDAPELIGELDLEELHAVASKF